MFIVVILAVIVVAGGVGFYLYKRSDIAKENKIHHEEARLKALKMQYMNGEITKEEYDELRARQQS